MQTAAEREHYEVVQLREALRLAKSHNAPSVMLQPNAPPTQPFASSPPTAQATPFQAHDPIQRTNVWVNQHGAYTVGHSPPSLPAIAPLPVPLSNNGDGLTTTPWGHNSPQMPASLFSNDQPRVTVPTINRLMMQSTPSPLSIGGPDFSPVDCDDARPAPPPPPAVTPSFGSGIHAELPFGPPLRFPTPAASGGGDFDVSHSKGALGHTFLADARSSLLDARRVFGRRRVPA